MMKLQNLRILALCAFAYMPGQAVAAEMIPQTELNIGPDSAQVSITVPANKEAYDMLPEKIRERGYITIGLESNAGYPNSITKNGVNYGLQADLGRALAASVGLEARLNTMPFANMIPAIDSGRVDFSSALFNDTLERREKVDFLNAGYSLGHLLLMKKGAEIEPLTMETICGRVISASIGTQQATQLTDRNEKCIADGDDPVDIKLAPSNAEAILAVKSGRVQAALLSAAQVTYITKADQEVQTSSLDEVTRTRATAFAFKKGGDLLPAFRIALLGLRAEGNLEAIFAQYNYVRGMGTVELIKNTQPLQPGAELP